MTSIFPDFRHAVDDGEHHEFAVMCLPLDLPCSRLLSHRTFRFVCTEPTEDWTVEEVMQWCLLRSHEATDSKLDELVNALNQQLEAGTRELWESHEIAVASVDGDKTENDDPQADSKKSASDDDNKKASKLEVKYIHVEVTEGHYQGNTYKLQPKARAPCWVGRSAGKKFRERGISLAKDDEVSTTHGKFELKNGKATFTDTGSTNGTVHESEELEDGVPLELKDGTILKMGGTLVKITLLRA